MCCCYPTLIEPTNCNCMDADGNTIPCPPSPTTPVDCPTDCVIARNYYIMCEDTKYGETMFFPLNNNTITPCREVISDVKYEIISNSSGIASSYIAYDTTKEEWVFFVNLNATTQAGVFDEVIYKLECTSIDKHGQVTTLAALGCVRVCNPEGVITPPPPTPPATCCQTTTITFDPAKNAFLKYINSFNNQVGAANYSSFTAFEADFPTAFAGILRATGNYANPQVTITKQAFNVFDVEVCKLVTEPDLYCFKVQEDITNNPEFSTCV